MIAILTLLMAPIRFTAAAQGSYTITNIMTGLVFGGQVSRVECGQDT